MPAECPSFSPPLRPSLNLETRGHGSISRCDLTLCSHAHPRPGALIRLIPVKGVRCRHAFESPAMQGVLSYCSGGRRYTGRSWWPPKLVHSCLYVAATSGVAICIELLRTQTDIDLLQEVAGVIANAAVCEEEGAIAVSKLGGIAPLMKHLQPETGSSLPIFFPALPQS